MQYVLKWRKFSIIIILLAVPFFFIGGPSSVSLQTFHRFWDLGHSIFFALVAVNLVWWNVVRKPQHLVVAFSIVLLLGVTIETLQTYVGRQASWRDVLANMAGFLLGYSLTQVSTRIIFTMRLVALLGLIPGVWAFAKSAAVSFVLWQQFPVLLSGENSLDQQAWGSQVHLQKRADTVGYKLQFPGEAFLSADMMGFIQSWAGFQKLILEIDNPSTENLVVVLRISDRQHELSNQDYSDRFNQRLLLVPGLNRVKINLQEIHQAPAKRLMDLDNIYLLKLFLPEDRSSAELHLNKMYLE